MTRSMPTRGLASGLGLALAMFLCVHVACGKEAAPASSDPAIEARMLAITSELRCLVCQNQTIADSHADLAEDLREQVRQQLRAGRTDREIVDYMTARYGDFVLYRPPIEARTVPLWFGPGVLLAGGLGALVLVLRRRSRMSDELFEQDEDSALDQDVHAEHEQELRA
jgi:cytochrome c-type biogenesis protein CcmH